jgi:hypothetical protein
MRDGIMLLAVFATRFLLLVLVFAATEVEENLVVIDVPRKAEGPQSETGPEPRTSEGSEQEGRSSG